MIRPALLVVMLLAIPLHAQESSRTFCVAAVWLFSQSQKIQIRPDAASAFAIPR
jgi:hypothetical protein